MDKIILDGNLISSKLYANLKKEYDEIKKVVKRKAKLSCILVGNDISSRIYLKNKEKKCIDMDIDQETINLDENITENELISIIQKLNLDDNVDGILIQLPLPNHINFSKIMSIINPIKDVDGFHPENIGNMVFRDKGLYPCTPQGILELLNEYNISVKSKDVVIIGRSNIVGKPLALMLVNEGATVQICNSLTKDLKSKTKNADILISATGVPNLINSEYLKDKAIVIDVGISKIGNKIVGDVDFDDVFNNSNVSHLSKVPGGVGPMTVYSLIKNTIKAYKLINELL